MATARRLLVVVIALVAGCAGVPKSHSERRDLVRQAAAAREQMLTEDPAIQPLLDRSVAHIVFPEVNQGAFVVGAGGGTGVIFENGVRTGYAKLSLGSFGASVGGQKFAEMIIVRDRYTLDKIKAGQLDVGAQASAVILRQGAASATNFGKNGLAIVVNPIKGAMVSAALTGQSIKTTM